MNTQKGFSTILGIVIALLVIGGGIYLYTNIERKNVSEELNNNTATFDTREKTEGSVEEIAEKYVKENSVEEIEFILKKDFDDGTFVKFYVIPTGKSAETTDEARIFLKKNDTGFKVIGFGTAFPGLEEEFPELKGQI